MRVLVGTSLLWIGLSALSDGITTLVVPVQLGGEAGEISNSQLGLITFIGLVAAMLVQPLAGRLSDRLRLTFGRQRFLASGVALIIVGLGLLASAHGAVAVGLAFVWLSLALSITQAPQQALMADLIPSARLGRAAGFKGFADLLGAVVGFALIGSLVAGGDVRPALLVLAIGMAASLGLEIVLLRSVADARPPTVHRRQGGLLTAYSLDRATDMPFIKAVLARFLFLLGTYAVGRFLVAFIASRLGLELEPAAEAAGGVLTALALVTAVGSLPAGLLADRLPRGAMTTAGAVVSVLGLVVLSLADNLGVIALGGVAMAVGSALFGVANWATLVARAPVAEAGRYLAVANIGTAGAAAGAGLFGLLIDLANSATPGSGYLALFGAAGLAFALSGAVSVFGERRSALQPLVS